MKPGLLRKWASWGPGLELAAALLNYSFPSPIYMALLPAPTTAVHLVYLVSGTNVRNHFQANFSMLSFLKQPAALDGITVVTDAPEFYQHLAGHVTILPIGDAVLRDWKGEFDFFWRVKIKALEAVAQQRPGTALLYLDSDTFLHGALPALQARLAEGQAFMHEREGALSELRSKTERRMWEQVGEKKWGGGGTHTRAPRHVERWRGRYPSSAKPARYFTSSQPL